MLGRHFRDLATLLGVSVGALALLGLTGAAAFAATGSCEISERAVVAESPYLGEIERLIQTQVPGSESHAEEAVPVDDVGTEIQRALGPQYGGEWYEAEAGDFAVGVTSGPTTRTRVCRSSREGAVGAVLAS